MTNWCLKTKKSSSLDFYKYLRESRSTEDRRKPEAAWKAATEFPYFVGMQINPFIFFVRCLVHLHWASISRWFALTKMVHSVGFYSYRSCSFNSEIAKYQGISLDSIYHITCNKGIPSRSTFQNENVRVQRSYEFSILKKKVCWFGSIAQ